VQLNECDNVPACSAATYSVNGKLNSRFASNNRSSPASKTAPGAVKLRAYSACDCSNPAESRSGWQNPLYLRPARLIEPGAITMQMTTALLIANPCDEEEDNMAMLCCHSTQGEMFLMTRYPDEDELEIALEGEPSTLEGVKVTLSPTLLKIEIAASDADVLNGDDVLEISHDTDAADLAEVELTLQNILKGTGTYISQL
jgi:hypothetical protein